MNTIVYIDGDNLDYGCLRHRQCKWLELKKRFADHIIRPQNPLSDVRAIKVYTPDIKAKVASHGQQAQSAQLIYKRGRNSRYNALMLEFLDGISACSQFVNTTFLCCKYGVRGLYLALTTPATPLTKAYQCGFFYA